MSTCDKLTGTLTLGATMSGGLLVAKGDKGDAYIITEADKQEIKEALSGDISELKGDLSSVGQQADSNKEEIANLTSSVNEKFLSSGLGILRTGKLYGTKVWKSAVNNSET